MYQYRKEFPIKIIPHIDENDEIVDNVHHYKLAKKPDQGQSSALGSLLNKDLGSAKDQIFKDKKSLNFEQNEEG